MRRWWRILLPAAVTAGVLAAAAPPAAAGDLDNDPRNNGLQVRMSLTCNSDRSVTLTWRSRYPRGADTVRARWFNVTTDPEHRSETPATHAAQVAAVSRRGDTAFGTFTIRNARIGDLIAVFVDGTAGAGDDLVHVDGIGRNLDRVPWLVWTGSGPRPSSCAAPGLPPGTVR